jgi:hypothetical protein
MKPVTTKAEIENSAKKAVEALYGTDITDFKARVVFAFPHEHKRDSWDVHIPFKWSTVHSRSTNSREGRTNNQYKAHRYYGASCLIFLLLI